MELEMNLKEKVIKTEWPLPEQSPLEMPTMSGEDSDQVDRKQEWQLELHDGNDELERPTMLGVTPRLNKNRRFVCNICDKGFPHASWLRKHDKVHLEFKYKCRFCTEMFSDQKIRLDHETDVHGPGRKYQCDKCQKSFNYPYSLENHYRIHTGERPFECDVCHKTFVERGAMTAHKRIHFEATPYHCQLCDQKYKHSSSLRAHKKIHERGGDFKCNLCSMCCISSKALKMHISKVHMAGLSKADKKVLNKSACSAKLGLLASDSFSQGHKTDLYPIMKLGKKFGIDFGSSMSANYGRSNNEDSDESCTEESESEPSDAKRPKLQTTSSESEHDQPPSEIVKAPVHRSLLSTDRKHTSKPNGSTSKGAKAVPISKKLQAKRKEEELAKAKMEEAFHSAMMKLVQGRIHQFVQANSSTAATGSSDNASASQSESSSQDDRSLQVQDAQEVFKQNLMLLAQQKIANSRSKPGLQPNFGVGTDTGWSPSSAFPSLVSSGRPGRKQSLPSKVKGSKNGVALPPKQRHKTEAKKFAETAQNIEADSSSQELSVVEFLPSNSSQTTEGVDAGATDKPKVDERPALPDHDVDYCPTCSGINIDRHSH